MKSKELAEILERASAPTSMGYGYTHYKEDVEALISYAHSLECRVDILNEKLGVKESPADEPLLNLFICRCCGFDLHGQEMWNPPQHNYVVCTNSKICDERKAKANPAE